MSLASIGAGQITRLHWITESKRKSHLYDLVPPEINSQSLEDTQVRHIENLELTVLAYIWLEVLLQHKKIQQYCKIFSKSRITIFIVILMGAYAVCCNVRSGVLVRSDAPTNIPPPLLPFSFINFFFFILLFLPFLFKFPYFPTLMFVLNLWCTIINHD